ncbi:hypothetical protein J4G02_22705, partial [Candidatus Poribacteria bacterium]|nr:hypothetical protein [Candidatus Poribacteria bacterium]
CLFLATFAYGNITIDGESVHVETDNYTVQFNQGVIEYIHNKLTDETYTHPKPRGETGSTGLYWRDKKVLTRTAMVVSATQLSTNAVELLYRQEGTDVVLSIAVDPMTDDLLIDMEGVSDTPGIVAMQWGMGYLDIQSVSVIVPSEGSPRNFFNHFYPSSAWEAQLAIAQGARGGFYIRNTDNTLQFKRFVYERADDGFAFNFGTYNQAPFDAHTTGSSQMWRFNTYAGGWRVPARIYREWMEQAFQPRRLSDIPWTEDITLVVLGDSGMFDLPERLAKLVDPSKTLLYLGDWAVGGEWWTKGSAAHVPDYFPNSELPVFLEAAQQYGFRVMLHAIVHGMSPSHPLYPHFQQYQYRDTWTGELSSECVDEPCDHPALHPLAHISPASSEWRNLLVSNLKVVWEEYPVDAFFLDASHSVINDGNGLIDGLNMGQGMALLHQELAEAMPGIVLGGERLHEATFAHESFAQRALMRGLTPHLISTFLFSPFVHAIGFSSFFPDQDPMLHNEMVRYNEFVGAIPFLLIGDTCYLDAECVEVHKLLEVARGWQHEYGISADVNGDGVVNILDLSLVEQNFGAILNHPEADINGDG